MRALDALDPEEVLIEGPVEGDALIRWAPQLQPPVAILVYADDEPARAVFYPFAAWSPEWQALLWATRRGRTVRFVDRPVAARLRAQLDAEKAAAEAAEEAARRLAAGDPPPDVDLTAVDEPVDTADDAPRDPLSRLAALDGGEDGEAWWNRLVEEGGEEDLFALVEAAMAEVRAADGPRDDDDAREACMRAEIAAALARTTGPVAAVVGAWHAPALRGGPRPGDKEHLKAAKKGIKVQATWVPWTDARLTMRSGYGAGIVSPGWYRTLWEARGLRSGRALAIRWQGRVARALRAHDRPAPTSGVIDAVRLTEALTALRGRARPGLDELRDASLATLCAGDEVPWALVARELLDGTAIGAVPEEVPSTPLAADLARQQKKLKLPPEAVARELAIDLRSDNGGARSRLLHRLVLLDVGWGKLVGAGTSRGTFRENWVLQWQPELSVKLAEALRWGTTLEGAATARTIDAIRGDTKLPGLAEAVRGALVAGLDAAAHEGVRRIDEVAAAGADVQALVDASPPLMDVLRYGTARELALEGLERLVEGLLDKVDLGLLHGARHLDADAATTLRTSLATLDAALAVYRDGARLDGWGRALGALADDDAVAPLVSGFAARRLHDRGRWTSAHVAARLASRLSPGVALPDAAAWLEGFLGDAAHVLIHDDTLLGIVDGWLLGLDEAALLEALPLLRRATSSFGPSERRRLLRTIAGEARRAVVAEAPSSRGAFDEGAALLATILGLEGA